MKKESIFPTYKILVQMKDLTDKLGDALNNKEFDKISQIKLKLLDLQRSLKKVL